MDLEQKSLYKEKSLALYNAYLKAREKIYEEAKSDNDYRCIHSRAIRMAIHTPQKRFWISEKRAYRIIRESLKHGESESKWKSRKGLNSELMRAYFRIRKKRMFKDMPLNFIACFVINEPSSGFFMSYSRAGRRICEVMRERRRSHGTDK